MCLLVINQKNSPVLPSAWLANFYQSNQDGVGLMYAQNGTLIIKKILPKSVNDFEEFYQQEIAGKECAFHLRMKTHGDINLDNCHPYEVLNQAEHGIDLWLMHNGILATGNSADTTRSDTWHYIANYLVPLLEGDPDYAFTDEFRTSVGKHIGLSNKFVLMDNLGRLQAINYDAGVHWGGLWLSNTYAWSAPYSAKSAKTVKHSKPSKKAKKQSKSAKPPFQFSTIIKNFDEKQAQADVAQLPIMRTFGNVGFGGCGSGFGSYQDYYAQELADGTITQEALFEMEEEDLFYAIDGELSELEYLGYSQVAQMNYYLIYDFIGELGIDSFCQLADMLKDGNMLEQEFIATLHNPSKAYRWISNIQTPIAYANEEKVNR